MRSSGTIGLFFGVWLASGAGFARAQAVPVELSWDAPAPCPPAEAVLAAIARDLGDNPHGGEEPMHAAARITGGGPFHLSLSTARGDATGSRALDASTCEELVDAAALIMSLMIDPDAVAAPAPTPAAEPEPEAAEPSPAPAPDVEPASALGAPSSAPASAPLTGFVRAQVELLTGALPALAPGASIFAGLSSGRFEVSIAAAAFPSQSATVAARPASGASLWLAFGRLEACYVLFGDAVRAGISGGIEVGSMHGTGFGVTLPTSGDTLWLAARAAATLTWRATRSLALRLAAGPTIPLLRPSFDLVGIGQAHQAAPVSLSVAFGASFDF